MYHVIDVVQDILMHASFDINKIVRKDVLYLDDDGSLNEHSFTYHDDDIWCEWSCYKIKKIVIGKELTQFPAGMLAAHRENTNNPDYEIEIHRDNPCFTYQDGAIFDKNMYKLIFFAENSRTSYAVPEGVLKIGESAFENCPNLCSVEIPDSVTEIGAYAFQNCRSLQSLIIPDGVLTIEDDAFYDVPHVFYKGNAYDWCDLHWGAQKYN